MEWDTIRQKWTEMTSRVQSPPHRADKRASAIKDTARDSPPAADTTPGLSSELSLRAADERSTV